MKDLHALTYLIFVSKQAKKCHIEFSKLVQTARGGANLWTQVVCLQNSLYHTVKGKYY